MSKKNKNKKYMKESATEAPNPQAETQEEAIETNQPSQPSQLSQDSQDSQSSQSSQDSQDSQSSEDSQSSATEEEKLLSALSEAEEKFNELHDKYLRQMAEFENYRKRTLKEKSELILNASAKLMTAVLPVLDDMDRAHDAMATTDDAASIREGFELIATKFRSILEQNGLKKIDTEGQPFDTDFHEAIAMVPATDDSLKGQVIDCVQKGYKLNDRVIRHSKVVVAN